MVRNINWNSANIAVWNKITFPRNNSDKQRGKIASEIMERKEAESEMEKLGEDADIYIACAGLTRFGGIDAILGNYICSLLEKIERLEKDKDRRLSLKDAVNAKMMVNRERIFDENMHHIGKK